MKHFLSLVLLFTFSSPCSGYANELDGVWRAVLTPQPQMRLVLGLDIEDGVATFISPNQSSKRHALDSFSYDEGSVSFNVDAFNVTFSGQHANDQIVGEFTQGQTFPLTFHRLDDDDTGRLAYEKQYLGTLEVSGQKLPLRVNVGVTKGGFVGTLDSLAQQSYGIPLDELTIDAQTLKFSAEALSVLYRGESNDEGGYQGLWVQGMPYPLTFAEITEDTPRPELPSSEIGDKGGAVAVLTSDNVEVTYFGTHDADTAYEIGSVSKTFVAYLLALAVRTDELALSTPLAKYFPGAPSTITLESLATHTSGLPRLPQNLVDGAVQQNPYAHYDEAALQQALAQQSVTQTSHAYSNYAVGALGEALAKAQGVSLQTLMQQRIFKPFAMPHSQLALTASPVNEALATPHDIQGNRVQPWRFQALAGAGAVVATLPDMVNYVQQLQQRLQQDDALKQLLLTPRVSAAACCQQALGWLLQEDPAGKVFAWHAGQTAGFVSYVGFYLDGSRAVVVLNNQVADARSYAESLLIDTKD